MIHVASEKIGQSKYGRGTWCADLTNLQYIVYFWTGMLHLSGLSTLKPIKLDRARSSPFPGQTTHVFFYAAILSLPP